MNQETSTLSFNSLGLTRVEELLPRLDSERDRALEKYEDLERKLLEFFECNGCSPARHFARRALTAVIEQLSAYPSQTTPAQVFDIIFEQASKIAQEALGFRTLLDHLHPERNRAAEQYERIRRELMRFFRHHDCTPPEDLADTTFDRVARKLSGQKIDNIAAFIMGFAKNIVREHRRLPSAVQVSDWDLLPRAQASALAQSERERKELQLACLEECLQELTPSRRQLFLEYFLFAEYYQGEERVKHRQRLAQRLGLTANSLQVRAHRLRDRMERCVRERIGKTVQGRKNFGAIEEDPPR